MKNISQFHFPNNLINQLEYSGWTVPGLVNEFLFGGHAALKRLKNRNPYLLIIDMCKCTIDNCLINRGDWKPFEMGHVFGCKLDGMNSNAGSAPRTGGRQDQVNLIGNKVGKLVNVKRGLKTNYGMLACAQDSEMNAFKPSGRKLHKTIDTSASSSEFSALQLSIDLIAP